MPRGFSCALSLHASQDRQPPTHHLPAVIFNPRIGIEIKSMKMMTSTENQCNLCLFRGPSDLAVHV